MKLNQICIKMKEVNCHRFKFGYLSVVYLTDYFLIFKTSGKQNEC